MEELFFVLLALFVVLGPWVFIIFLFVRMGTVRSEVEALLAAVKRARSEAEAAVAPPEVPAVTAPPEPDEAAPVADAAIFRV